MTKTVVEISEVSAEFADVLAQIHAEAFEAPWPAEAFQKLIPDPFRFCFLAQANQDPAGLLLLQCVGPEAEVLTLATRPAYRRQGVGRALLRYGMAFAANRGARRLFLEVAEGNQAALALYDSFGFETVGRRSGYYQDGEAWRDAHILEVRLSCPAKTEPIGCENSGWGDQASSRNEAVDGSD